MTFRVSPIVEGHGDAEAVPILISRIVQTLDPACHIEVTRPIRIPKSKLLRPGEFERAVEFAFRRSRPQGAVLVLIDADEDCPAELAPQLMERVRQARSDVTTSVVLPKREFEAWFIAAIESLAGCRGLADDVRSVPDPEEIRGAKEWLSQNMHRSYRETLDQAAFAAQFDLTSARRVPSFDKCWREIEKLTQLLRTAE